MPGVKPGSIRSRRYDVAQHAAFRVWAFPYLVPVISRDDDDVAGAVGAAHDADMAVVASALQHHDRADARAVDALAVFEERLRGARIGRRVAGAAQDEVDEVRAPQVG